LLVGVVVQVLLAIREEEVAVVLEVIALVRVTP
jgi:hypothetical protein